MFGSSPEDSYEISTPFWAWNPSPTQRLERNLEFHIRRSVSSVFRRETSPHQSFGHTDQDDQLQKVTKETDRQTDSIRTKQCAIGFEQRLNRSAPKMPISVTTSFS